MWVGVFLDPRIGREAYWKMKRGWILALVIALLVALSVPALADYGAVANTKVKLYKDAQMTDKAGTLSKYTAVVVKETASGIARIKHDGKIYYVPEAALSRPWEDIKNEMKARGVDETWEYNRFLKTGCYAFVRPKSDSDNKRLKRNMVVWACYEKGEWTLVECNGYYGYIKTEYLEKKSEQKGITNEELDRIAREEKAREEAKLAKQKAKLKAAQEKAAQQRAEQQAAEQQQQAQQNP